MKNKSMHFVSLTASDNTSFGDDLSGVCFICLYISQFVAFGKSSLQHDYTISSDHFNLQI